MHGAWPPGSDRPIFCLRRVAGSGYCAQRARSPRLDRADPLSWRSHEAATTRPHGTRGLGDRHGHHDLRVHGRRGHQPGHPGSRLRRRRRLHRCRRDLSGAPGPPARRAQRGDLRPLAEDQAARCGGGGLQGGGTHRRLVPGTRASWQDRPGSAPHRARRGGEPAAAGDGLPGPLPDPLAGARAPHRGDPGGPGPAGCGGQGAGGGLQQRERRGSGGEPVEGGAAGLCPLRDHPEQLQPAESPLRGRAGRGVPAPPHPPARLQPPGRGSADGQVPGRGLATGRPLHPLPGSQSAHPGHDSALREPAHPGGHRALPEAGGGRGPLHHHLRRGLDAHPGLPGLGADRRHPRGAAGGDLAAAEVRLSPETLQACDAISRELLYPMG